MVSEAAFRDRRQRVTCDSLLGASHSYGSFRRNEKPGQAGPRERGGARPARQSAQGAAAALALAPGQAGPSGARRQSLIPEVPSVCDSRSGTPYLVLSGEVSPRRVGIGGSGRFLVNAVRGRFLSDEPLTPWARVTPARPSGVEGSHPPLTQALWQSSSSKRR